MRHPSVRDLDPGLLRAAAWIARTLRDAGHEAWLVGGSVRDLALDRPATDLDLATDAEPERLEALFQRTHAVGRAFGTVIVPFEGRGFEVTTFRTEAEYTDGRRPDVVRFGHTVEEDARRRDFTCNALYLDPLDDVLRDPAGGMTDLAAGLLRAVGEPRERFREDGLRVLRLARFAAVLELAVDPATREAARAEVGGLAGVSAERVLEELARAFSAGAGAPAVECLVGLDALGACLPRTAGRNDLAERVRALADVDARRDVALSFAALLDPVAPAEGGEASLADLDRLRPSRRLRSDVVATWAAARRLEALAADGAPRRSAVVRAARAPRAAEGRALAAARARAAGAPTAHLARAGAALDELTEADLRPKPLVDAALLDELAVPRGPRWGELLAAAEDAQLDGEICDRADARRWVAERARGQDGGNRPRSHHDSG